MMDKRIAFVIPGTGVSGGIRCVLELAAGLSLRGWDATVICTSRASAPIWFNKRVNYIAGGVDTAKILRELNGLKVCTWPLDAKLVHGNSLPHERLYIVFDDARVYFPDSLNHSRVEWGWQQDFTFLTLSRRVHEWFTQSIGQHAHYIGIGLDQGTYYYSGKSRIPNSILFPYRYEKSWNDLKGSKIAVSVIHELIRRGQNIVPISFGTTPAPRLSGRHRHYQNVSDGDVAELYRLASCFLYTSRYEGFGLPALEAMACGCPVVSTDAFANMEFCQDGYTCLIGKNESQLADHVQNVLNHDPDIDRRLMNARKKAAEYKWDEVCDWLSVLGGEICTQRRESLSGRV